MQLFGRGWVSPIKHKEHNMAQGISLMMGLFGFRDDMMHLPILVKWHLSLWDRKHRNPMPILWFIKDTRECKCGERTVVTIMYVDVYEHDRSE